MSVRCSYIKPDGNRCQAYALKNGKGFCFRHDPDLEEERARASSRGGRRTADLKKPVKDKKLIKKVITGVESIVGEVVTTIDPRDINELVDLERWTKEQMGMVKDNQSYAKPSYNDVAISLKLAEFLEELIVNREIELLKKHTKGLEEVVYRDGENGRY